MSEPKLVATATVILTMEIRTSGSNWGQGCTIDQIHKQAKDQAYGFIVKLKTSHPNEIINYSIDRIKVITHEEVK